MPPDPIAILVTGGTGLLGTAFADVAAGSGHRVRLASRRAALAAPPEAGARLERMRVDVATGEGVDAALDGVQAVLHAATDPRGDPRATDVEGTRRLLEASRRAGVLHFLYPSIVGVDRIPWAYYVAKRKAEELVEASGVPHTVLRLTQFHSFVDLLLSRAARLPLMPLPTRVLLQSIAVEEAAAHLLARFEAGPAGRAPDAAGPEVLTLGAMARSWIRARGARRRVLPLPLPGRVGRAFRAGFATAPERAVGVETWEAWLARAYGSRG